MMEKGNVSVIVMKFLKSSGASIANPQGGFAFPTPCARPNVSLLANTSRRGKAVAIQTGPQDAIPKERNQ